MDFRYHVTRLLTINPQKRMLMSILRKSLAIALLLSAAGSLVASEADDYRKKAEAIKREAMELAERGRMEEAKKLGHEAEILFKKAKYSEQNRKDPRWLEIEEIKKYMQQLAMEEKELSKRDDAKPRIEEIRAESEKLERVIHEMMVDMKAEKNPKGKVQHDKEMHHEKEAMHREHEEQMHRLESMRIAVDHLHQAGLHDIAEHVAERAEATEREIHERRMHEERMRDEQAHREHPEHGEPMHEMMRHIEELRHEIGRLHEELNRLRDR